MLHTQLKFVLKEPIIYCYPSSVFLNQYLRAINIYVQKLEETFFRNDDTPFFPLLRLSLAMPQSEPSPQYHHSALLRGAARPSSGGGTSPTKHWILRFRHVPLALLLPRIILQKAEKLRRSCRSPSYMGKKKQKKKNKKKVREDQGSKVNDSEKT